MSRTLALTDATFGSEIEAHEGLAMVDFGASWCPPCRMIAPVVDKLAEEYGPRVKVATVDTDANPETAARFNIRSLPTLLFFKDGTVVDSVIGAVPKPVLDAKLRQHGA